MTETGASVRTITGAHAHARRQVSPRGAPPPSRPRCRRCSPAWGPARAAAVAESCRCSFSEPPQASYRRTRAA
eukprot:6258968-Pyramimonas_sp.AAC.1